MWGGLRKTDAETGRSTSRPNTETKQIGLRLDSAVEGFEIDLGVV